MPLPEAAAAPAVSQTDAAGLPNAAELQRVVVEIGERRILDDVSLALPAGQLSAIVGPNGCGKSTIARMLTAFLYPTSGVVRILDQRLGETNVHRLRERVKLVQPTPPHEPSDRFDVRQVILAGAFGTVDLFDKPTPEHHARADEVIGQLGLSHVAASRFRTCSTGERMRTQIARALMTRPALLILDEPTSGLDLPAREQLLTTLDALLGAPRSPAILLVTHHVEELSTATRQVILMAEGRVVRTGAPAEVLTSAALSAAFRWPIEVRADGGRYFAHAGRAAAVDVA